MSYWGWSVSKQNLWEDCPKAYYYQYIHSWKLCWEEKDRFKILKGLQTVPLIHGTHISAILRKVLNGELLRDIDGLKELFEKEMKETFAKGRERVTERYNGLDMSDEYFERHIENGKKEIEYFVAEICPKVKDMEMKAVDKRGKYTMEGRAFYSAPDFLAVDDQGVWHLMDWKSGTGAGTGESPLDLQLTTYAHYAINYTAKGRKPNKIKLYVVFLQDPSKNVEKDLTDEMLEETKSKVMPEERKCSFATSRPSVMRKSTFWKLTFTSGKDTAFDSDIERKSWFSLSLPLDISTFSYTLNFCIRRADVSKR
jgi:hypothetical protein